MDIKRINFNDVKNNKDTLNTVLLEASKFGMENGESLAMHELQGAKINIDPEKSVNSYFTKKFLMKYNGNTDEIQKQISKAIYDGFTKGYDSEWKKQGELNQDDDDAFI